MNKEIIEIMVGNGFEVNMVSGVSGNGFVLGKRWDGSVAGYEEKNGEVLFELTNGRGEYVYSESHFCLDDLNTVLGSTY